MSVLGGPSTTEPTVTGAGPAPSTGASGTAGPNGSTSGTMTAQAGGTEVGLPEAFEVFENKDPFRPLIVLPEETSGETVASTAQATTSSSTTETGSGTTTSGTTTDGGSTDGGGTDDDGDTSTNSLTLKSITYDDGEYTAVFEYGGKEYSTQEGDVIDSSPWKVVNITSSSVTLLYGDEEIVLRLGGTSPVR